MQSTKSGMNTAAIQAALGFKDRNGFKLGEFKRRGQARNATADDDDRFPFAEFRPSEKELQLSDFPNETLLLSGPKERLPGKISSRYW